MTTDERSIDPEVAGAGTDLEKVNEKRICAKPTEAGGLFIWNIRV
jgi:hypothetical protein